MGCCDLREGGKGILKEARGVGGPEEACACRSMRMEWTVEMAIGGGMPRIGDVAESFDRWVGGLGQSCGGSSKFWAISINMPHFRVIKM